MDGVSAYRDAGLLAMLAMEYGAASRMLAQGRRYADSIEQSHCAHVMTATSSMVAWAGGHWKEATTEAGQAMVDRGCRRGAEIGRWTLGYAALGRGDVAEAERELDESWRFGLASESIELVLPPLWGLAELALQTGDPGRAVERCEDALDQARTVAERILLLPFVVTGVRACHAAGRPAEAAAWLSACAEHLAPLGDAAAVPIAHGRGLLALAEGATGIARAHLETAVSGWDGIGRIWEATWARLDLASCHIRANRFADAVPIAVEARTVASRLESRPLAERSDALLHLARGRVSTSEPWRPLTSREFAVAQLIGRGLTNAEIADALGIAPKTASSHVEHILAKLGASRRAEIATWASHVGRSPALT
jgi:DNA-binding CsgD family transcriptional regulator